MDREGRARVAVESDCTSIVQILLETETWDKERGEEARG